MAEINWGLMGQMPDAGATFMQAYEQGRAHKQQQMGQNALAAYATDPTEQNLNALAPYAPEVVIKERQRLAEQQHEQALARVKLIGDTAMMADTPEKWDRAVEYLSRQFPELAQYKGQFQQREAAIAASGQAKAYLEQNAGYTLSPGSKRYDAGNRLVAEAPFAPKEVTVKPGESTYTYQPGAGAPMTVDGLRPLFLAQESGGNYAAVNKVTGALGAYQIMPQTGQALAQRLGVPWRQDLMTGDSPEARAYQDQLGTAAIQEAITGGGGNPSDVFSYYYGGSDRSKWGPNTRQYASEMMGRMGGATKVADGGQKPQWRTLSADEARKAGLPDGTYQQSPDGKIEAVSPPKGAGSGPQPGTPAYSQSAMDAFDRAISTARRLKSHDGLPTAVGAKGITGGLLGGWVPPGTDAADFLTELDTMKSQVFLPMVQSMKGMGALSNAEGEKLTAAIGNLSPKQSEAAFKASLDRIIADLNTYRARAVSPQSQAGGGQGKARGPSVSNW